MKNFKLLLATTAILSTGLAANSFAEEPVVNSSTVNAILRAGIMLYAPITMNSQNGYLYFPAITTTPKDGADSVKVKVNYDGTIDHAVSNAQILDSSNSVTPILITGGDISQYQSEYAGKTAEEIAALNNAYNEDLPGSFDDRYDVSVASTIPMTVDGDGTTPCGTVTDLTRRWHYNSTLNSNTGGLELSFGGTFELHKNDNGTYYTPADGSVSCSGETTVTLVLH